MNTKTSEFQAALRAGLSRIQSLALIAGLTATGAPALFGQQAGASGEVVQLEKFVATGSRFNDRP